MTQNIHILIEVENMSASISIVISDVSLQFSTDLFLFLK